MGGSPSPPPPRDDSAMIAEMKAMRQQQEAAAKAAAEVQRQAMIDAQNNAAQQGVTQSRSLANQNLMRQEEYQKALDSAAGATASKQAGAMGAGMTGGAFDVNSMEQARMSNLGAATAYIPPTAANQAATGGAKTQLKDAQKAQLANSFSLPATQGLTFGGS